MYSFVFIKEYMLFYDSNEKSRNKSLYFQIISYLRICLARSSNITVQNDSLEHPSEFTPLIGRYLEKLYKENPDSLYHYVDSVVLFAQVTGGKSFILRPLL